jgi:hypothetical protein
MSMKSSLFKTRYFAKNTLQQNKYASCEQGGQSRQAGRSIDVPSLTAKMVVVTPDRTNIQSKTGGTHHYSVY